MSDERKLVKIASAARERSYCPYSGKSVGAALLCANGRVYTGANVESASFSPTVCAERVALLAAVHAGERRFVAMAVVGSDKGESAKDFFTPCGVCRQLLAEFCSEDFKVIVATEAQLRSYTLGELLPNAFKGDVVL